MAKLTVYKRVERAKGNARAHLCNIIKMDETFHLYNDYKDQAAIMASFVLRSLRSDAKAYALAKAQGIDPFLPSSTCRALGLY